MRSLISASRDFSRYENKKLIADSIRAFVGSIKDDIAYGIAMIKGQSPAAATLAA